MKVHIMRSLNKLPLEKRDQILTMLVEGSSLRSISRVAGVSINTVTKLLIDAGHVCAAFHDAKVRKVAAKAVQCDEIWSFAYAKQKNVKFAKSAPEGAGDIWTRTAIDADSKLVVSWHVGNRSQDTGTAFMGDLKARLANRVQLTTDGHRAYLAVADVDADYAMLNKIFATDYAGPGRYSPTKCIGAIKNPIMGNSDPALVNTSFAKRQNLTMRMAMRRFTRLTNTFSKKFENHCHSLALYFCWYNFIREHKTLGVTPAMGAGLIDRKIHMAEVVQLLDERKEAQIHQRRAQQLYAPQSN
jgi:IS1 family transposase